MRGEGWEINQSIVCWTHRMIFHLGASHLFLTPVVFIFEHPAPAPGVGQIPSGFCQIVATLPGATWQNPRVLPQACGKTQGFATGLQRPVAKPQGFATGLQRPVAKPGFCHWPTRNTKNIYSKCVDSSRHPENMAPLRTQKV